LPPFTTFVHAVDRNHLILQVRLIGFDIRRTDSVSLSSCFDIILELQARLPGRFGERLHAAVILIAAAIKTTLSTPLALRALRDTLPTTLAAAMLPPPLMRLHFAVERTRGNDRAPSGRPSPARECASLVRCTQSRGRSACPPASCACARESRRRCACRDNFRTGAATFALLLAYAAVFAPALPAFFFKRSPVMRTPFCLYGSGGRSARRFAATCPPDSCSRRKPPCASAFSTVICDPFGNRKLDRVRISQRQHHVLALHFGAIADAHDVQILLEARS
jgi:hypothetical protein